MLRPSFENIPLFIHARITACRPRDSGRGFPAGQTRRLGLVELLLKFEISFPSLAVSSSPDWRVFNDPVIRANGTTTKDGSEGKYRNPNDAHGRRLPCCRSAAAILHSGGAGENDLFTAAGLSATLVLILDRSGVGERDHGLFLIDQRRSADFAS